MIEAWAVRILFAAAVGVACWFHGFGIGRDRVQDKWDAALAEAEKANQKEKDRIRAAEDKLRADHAKTVSAINARLADALERLRERPERRPMPESPAPACSGATGADLSGPDATFLVREAARADRLRAALAECYGAIDAANRASELKD